jgi:hypothetical protein
MMSLSDSDYDDDIELVFDDHPMTLAFYKPSGSPTFAPSSGRVTQGYTSEEVTGMVEDLDLHEVEQSHGKYEVGDRRFYSRIVDLTLVLDTRCWVVEDSKRYQLISANNDPTGRLWDVVGRPDGMQTTTTTTTTLVGTTTTTTTTTTTAVTTAAGTFPFPDSLVVGSGGIASGGLDDVEFDDGVELVLEEVTGTPGLDYTFVWEGSSNVQYKLVLKGYYVGNVGHTVLLYQWNYTLSQWDRVTANAQDFPDEASEQTYNYTLLTPVANYRNDCGEMQLRIYHTSPGNMNHEFIIDQMYLEVV